MSTHSCGLSRQYIQPFMDALTNLVAVSLYSASLLSLSVLAQMASWSIAVPTSFQLMTAKSSGV